MLKLNIQPDDVCFALKDDAIAKDELKSLMLRVCLECSDWVVVIDWIVAMIDWIVAMNDRTANTC